MMICSWTNLAYSGTVQTRLYGVLVKRRRLGLVSSEYYVSVSRAEKNCGRRSFVSKDDGHFMQAVYAVGSCLPTIIIK